MCSRLSVYPISERRLRPIYDWLDNGNNKKALQEAEKVLKKQPNLQCARVLKCLALLRLGKESDSMEQLELIRSECPTEEATLQLMTVCYREIHKPNLICSLYESANQKDPGNEEILTNLFLSYVRIGDFKRQQSTAMSLFKVKSKNQYYFWNIISLLIQTADNLSDIMPYFTSSSYYLKDYSNKPPPIENEKDFYLRLAEKMVEKHVSKKKIETDQEVLIYLIILEMQGKLKEALNVINGDLGSKLELSTVINKRIDLFIKLELWAEANELLKVVLLEDIDAWNYILLYLDTVFQLGKGRTFNSEDENCPFYKTKEFLNVLMKENKSSNLKKRGPYLAQLEFYSRLMSEDQPGEKIIGDILDCMVEYVQLFGTKESCLHDLRPYLYLVDPVQFLSQVCELVSLKSGEFPKTRAQMNLHLTNIELVKVFGIRESFKVSERLQSVNNMLQYFIHGLKFNNDLPPTEPRSNDRYALLAVHTLYEVWIETEDYNHLFEGIVLCHYALHHSPSNSQLKTLLLKFYHLLGGTEGAHSAYLSLDLKHMQLDTLGYMHVFPLLANAEYNHAKTVLNCTLKFFTNNFKESADHITFAYKYDALTKIPEFIHIREKLNYSTHYRQATLEKMLLDIFLAPTYSNTVQIVKEMLPIDKIEWNLLQDNRDFTVLWDVDPENKRLSYSAIEQTYLLDIVFLRLRSLLLQICASCIQLGSGDFDSSYEEFCDNNEKNTMSSNYCSLKQDLYTHTMELFNNLKTLQNNSPNSIPNRFIGGPPHSRLIIILQCNYFDPIINELKFLLYLLPGEHSSKENANIQLESIILYFKEYINVVSEELLKCDNPASRNIVIQMSSLFVEIVSLSCVVAGVCDSVLRKFKLSLAKKGKKTNKIRTVENSSDFDWRADVSSKYINVVTSYIKYLETVLRSEEKSWKEKNIKMGVKLQSSHITFA